MIKNLAFIYLILAFCFVSSSCKVDKELQKNYAAEKVIIVIVDGARYSETWGDSTQQYIPFQKAMAAKGTLFSSVYNDGVTNTVNGHAAITTGTYESLINNGSEIPDYPSYFQIYRKVWAKDSTKAWIVTSKDKLEVLKNCSESDYSNQFMPSTDCGISGLGTGYRNDTTTLVNALHILKKYEPDVMLIQFKEPDATAHTGDWTGYLNGIKTTDVYLNQIYNFINTSEKHKGKTALFITNDHGRHLDGVFDGFVSHGCSCDGCRHISLLGIGPDFKTGAVINNRYSQIDLAYTIAEMLHVQLRHSNGKIIKDLFEK